MRARVRSSNVISPAHDNDTSFAMALWVGTIGGSALPTDPDPNVSAPLGSRILRLTPKRGVIMADALPQLRTYFVPVAASSITTQLWIFDTALAKWIIFNPPVTTTPTGSASNINALVIGAGSMGADSFLQITANTLVQCFGQDCI